MAKYNQTKNRKKKSKIKRSNNRPSFSIFQINNFISKHPFLLSILLSSFLFLLIYSLFIPHYQTNDDISMMLRAAGVCRASAPSGYILFTNIIIGWILSFLYSTFPGSPWYTLYLITGLIVAHSALSYISFKLRPQIITLGLILLYYLLLGNYLLLELQFTIVGSMVSFAGLVLIINYSLFENHVTTLKESLKKPQVILGILIIMFGFMIRWRSMIMASIFIGCVIVIIIFRKPRKQIIRTAALLSISLVLCAGTFYIHQHMYSKDPGWKNYLEFNRQRAKLVEGELFAGMPVEESNAILSSVGWTVVDYQMMANWFFLDSEIYSQEKLKHVLSQLPSAKTGLPFSIVFDRAMDILKSDYSINVFLFLLFGILASRIRRENLLALIGGIAVVSALVVYLIYFWKAPPERVYYPLLAFVAWLPLILEPGSITRKIKNKWAIQNVVLVLLLLPSVYKIYQNLSHHQLASKSSHINNKWLKQEVSKILANHSQQQNLYVIWGPSLPWEVLNPFEDIRYLKSFNVLGLGAAQQAPSSFEILDKFGIDNLYHALVNRNDVLLLLSNNNQQNMINLLNAYYQQHFSHNITVTKFYSNEMFSIFKLGKAALQ